LLIQVKSVIPRFRNEVKNKAREIADEIYGLDGRFLAIAKGNVISEDDKLTCSGSDGGEGAAMEGGKSTTSNVKSDPRIAELVAKLIPENNKTRFLHGTEDEKVCAFVTPSSHLMLSTAFMILGYPRFLCTPCSSEVHHRILLWTSRSSGHSPW
jgi:hypothetical protein